MAKDKGKFRNQAARRHASKPVEVHGGIKAHSRRGEFGASKVGASALKTLMATRPACPFGWERPRGVRGSCRRR